MGIKMQEFKERVRSEREKEALKKSPPGQFVWMKLFSLNDMKIFTGRGWEVEIHQPQSYGAPQMFLMKIDRALLKERLNGKEA